MRNKTYSIFGIDIEEVEEEIIFEETKPRKKALHYNLLKKTRSSKKGDYFDKKYVYYIYVKYKRCRAIKKMIENRQDKKNSLDIINTNVISLYKELVQNYTNIALKNINHINFRSIPESLKKEMVGDAVMRGLESGTRESNENFGTPYLMRFDEYRSDQIFSYWTQIISNFFIQYLIAEKHQIDIKHLNLQTIIGKFNTLWSKSGIKFNLGDVVSKD